MKAKILSILFLALVSLTANAMQSGTDPSLTVERKDSSSTYVIKYNDMQTGKVILTMKDPNGNILLRRNIKNQNRFAIPVNLSSLEHGHYLVNVDNGTKDVSVTIQYNNNTEPTHNRVVSLGDNRYLLMSSHVGRQTLIVKISDENGNVIFNEERSINGQISILFNLSGVFGRPSFEITETSGNSLMLPANPIVVSMLKPIKITQGRDLN